MYPSSNVSSLANQVLGRPASRPMVKLQFQYQLESASQSSCQHHHAEHPYWSMRSTPTGRTTGINCISSLHWSTIHCCSHKALVAPMQCLLNSVPALSSTSCPVNAVETGACNKFKTCADSSSYIEQDLAYNTTRKSPTSREMQYSTSGVRCFTH